MNPHSIEVLQKTLQSGFDLPTLSPVATRLIQLASNDMCSVSDLVQVIESDPSLAVRLLKLANSAFFRSFRPVTTLKQAVMRIGFQQLRLMGLSLSLREILPAGKEGAFDYEGFWRISLYRALLSRSLAQQTGGTNPEEAFTAGLILEIGLILFHQLFSKTSNEPIPLSSGTLEELIGWEEARSGVNHRQVGEAVLRHWNFPENTIACQRLCGMKVLHWEEVPPLVRVCEVARRWSLKLFLEPDGFQTLFSEALVHFGLGEAIVNEMIIRMFSQVEEIAQTLRIEVNADKDLLGLMEKANQALVNLSVKMATASSGDSPNPFPSFETLPEGANRSEAVNQTLQAVAHEIRNPLAAVAGFARRLSKTLMAGSDGGKYADIILREAMKLEAALDKMKA